MPLEKKKAKWDVTQIFMFEKNPKNLQIDIIETSLASQYFHGHRTIDGRLFP